MPESQRWLITGGCGFIGRSLITRLRADRDGPQVVVFDDLSVGSAADLRSSCGAFDLTPTGSAPTLTADTGLQLVVGDVLDINALRSATTDIDVMIHLAANTGVGPSVEDPIADCHANVLGTLNALEASRHHNVSRFVFASSGAPLGVQTPPLHEELAPRPASPYGASKLAGEGYCSAYYQCFGIETVALRFGNVYGPGSMHKSSVVAKFIREALAGESWEIYGDGTQTRDYIYIDDLVDAIRAATTRQGVGGNVFQIATSRETTVHELADHLRGLLIDRGVKVPDSRHTPARRGDVQRNYSDTSKANEMLGWSSRVELLAGLQSTLDYFMIDKGAAE